MLICFDWCFISIIGIVIASAFRHFSFCTRIAWKSGRNDFGIIFDLPLNGWLGLLSWVI
jgi:hypothetical protein